MEIKYPDYDRSILSVAASVLKHYGVNDCRHKSLPEFDCELNKNPENVIVMLFDGIGSSILDYHLPEDAFLRQKKVCDISSVFPPTTTAATTSVQSGYSPLEHSWLGWTLYFNEIDENVFAFRNVVQRTDKKFKKYNVADKYIPYNNIFERIKQADPSVETHYLAMQSDEKVFSVGAAMRKIKKIAKRPGKKYIYLYWFQPDHAMHKKGIHEQSVTKIIKNIDKHVKKLCSSLTNSVAVVIADHGLVDIQWDYLDNYPELYNMLVRAPSIEPRALSLFVKDGCKDNFKKLFNSIFGDKFILMTKEQVYESGLLGSGNIGRKTDDFLGDFLAVATDNLCIAANNNASALKANHAGLTKDEMTVPFIVTKSMF